MIWIGCTTLFRRQQSDWAADGHAFVRASPDQIARKDGCWCCPGPAWRSQLFPGVRSGGRRSSVMLFLRRMPHFVQSYPLRPCKDTPGLAACPDRKSFVSNAIRTGHEQRSNRVPWIVSPQRAA
jgi:hypothetical protein